MADYTVVVVDQAGDPFGTLSDPEVNRPSWESNGWGSVEIGLATTDPTAALMVAGREIQIYYDGGTVPLWWGVIVRPQAGLDRSSWRCVGHLWYFGKRFMGTADRTDQLVNGGFEDGETGWTFSGVTHSVNTNLAHVVDGAKSEKLTGATADHNTYASQTWEHGGVTPPGWPGDFMTIAGWVEIPSAAYVAGALGDRGLVAVHWRDGNVINVEVATIGDDTIKDQAIPIEVGIPVVRAGDSVEVRLYPPQGDAYWDLVTLTFMESLSFGDFITGEGVDVTDIIGGIVAYAQDPTAGKSDLNIGFAGDPTGVDRLMAWQFAEHRNILDAIMEFVREGICDVSVEVVDATTRTFTVWPKSVDSRGLGKGVHYATTLELDVNLADFNWATDLDQGGSSVVELGPGDGPDRPEGGATDAAFAGGLFTAEIVEQASDHTTVGQLDSRAQERVKVTARPEVLEVVTLPGAGIIGTLQIGDTVDVVISRGHVNIDETYRVVRVEADLHKDQATISLNLIP